MIRAAADAVLALLRVNPLRKVYDAQAPSGVTTPYLVVYTDGGLEERYTQDGRIKNVRFLVVTHAIGKDPREARIAQEWARDALLMQRPVIAGFTSTHIRRDSGAPIARDDDVSPPLYYGVDVWKFSTNKEME